MCFHPKSLNGRVSNVFEDRSQILLVNPIYGVGSPLFDTYFQHQSGLQAVSGREISCQRTEFSKMTLRLTQFRIFILYIQL